jgi:cysteine-S-conjugate beta-lyase
VTKKDTKLVEVGRAPSLHAGAVNTPVYRVSTVLFPDVESLTNNSQPYT